MKKKFSFILSLLSFTTFLVAAHPGANKFDNAADQIPNTIKQIVNSKKPALTVTKVLGIPLDLDLNTGLWYVKEDVSPSDEVTFYHFLVKGPGTIRVTYDANGELVSERAILENVPLPREIQLAIGRHFPGWGVIENKVIAATHRGDLRKAQFQIKLKSPTNDFIAVFDANGNLLKGKRHAVKSPLLNI